MNSSDRTGVRYVPDPVVHAARTIPRSALLGVEWLLSSFLRIVAAAGVLCLVVAVLLSFTQNGIMSGMFGVWGASALLGVSAAYVVLLWLQ